MSRSVKVDVMQTFYLKKGGRVPVIKKSANVHRAPCGLCKKGHRYHRAHSKARRREEKALLRAEFMVD